MSEFITSFFESVHPKTKYPMKFTSKLHKNQWAFYPLPFFYFYLETCLPDSHASFWKNKICGLYLSLNWLKWSYVLGSYKSI